MLTAQLTLSLQGLPLPLLHLLYSPPTRPRSEHLHPSPRKEVHTDAPVLVLKPSLAVAIRVTPLSPSEKESRRCRKAPPRGHHRLPNGLPPHAPTKPPPAAPTPEMASWHWHELRHYPPMLSPPSASAATVKKCPSTPKKTAKHHRLSEPSGVVGPHIAIRLSRIFRPRPRARSRSTVLLLWATHQIRKSRGQGVG